MSALACQSAAFRPGCLHEIKHDGFRIIAHRSGDRVRLATRAGNNFASRFPLIAAAIAALPMRSCVIDGEAIACDENGRMRLKSSAGGCGG